MATIVVEPVASGEIRIGVDVSGQDEVDHELEEIYGDIKVRESLGEKVVRISKPAFTEALDLVQACAKSVADRLDAMGDVTPDEVEMQLAIRVDGKASAKLVEVSGGAQLQVVLRWRRR